MIDNVITFKNFINNDLYSSQITREYVIIKIELNFTKA
jgi:hypothetical protein